MTREEILNCVLYYDYFCDRFFDRNNLDADLQGEQNYIGCAGDLVALLCWKVLFHSNKTFIVAAPNGQLASHWCQLVQDAIQSLPKELKVHAICNRQREIKTNNMTSMTFEVMSRNTARGQTIGGMYLIESHMVNATTYKQFWESAVPVLYATKAQVVHYTRGY